MITRRQPQTALAKRCVLLSLVMAFAAPGCAHSAGGGSDGNGARHGARIAAQAPAPAGADAAATSAASILFAPDGTEYADPSDRAVQAARDEAAAGRGRAAMGRLASAVDREGGYSRLVAAKAIWRWIRDNNGDGNQYLTPESVTRIARGMVELGDSGLKIVVYEELVRRPRAVMEVMHPVCAVTVDGRRYRVADGLPWGWRAEDVEVEIDGKVLPVLLGEWNVGVGGIHQMVPDDLNNTFHVHVIPWEHIDRDKWLGDHLIVTRMRLAAPDGTTVDLRSERKVEVGRLQDYVQ